MRLRELSYKRANGRAVEQIKVLLYKETPHGGNENDFQKRLYKSNRRIQYL